MKIVLVSFFLTIEWVALCILSMLSLYFVTKLSQNSGVVSGLPDAADLCFSIRLSSFLHKQTFISSQDLCLCVSVFIFVSFCLCIYICIFVFAHLYLCICICVFVFVYFY